MAWKNVDAAGWAETVVDFRRAAESDGREQDLRFAVELLRENLLNAAPIAVILPREHRLAAVNRVVGTSLVGQIVALASASECGVTIHARPGAAGDFLAAGPLPCVRLAIHLNAEEAAMRWERDDPAPSARLRAAARLAAAGWNTSVLIGPVRDYPGWKDDYSDIVERAVEAGFRCPDILFPENGLLDDAIPASVNPEMTLTGRGVVVGMNPRKRRNIRTCLERVTGSLQGHSALRAA